jgi:hypothetical protein
MGEGTTVRVVVAGSWVDWGPRTIEHEVGALRTLEVPDQGSEMMV